MIQPEVTNERTALDTSIFIYAFEEHPTFWLVASEILRMIDNGQAAGIISSLTIGELSVGPLQRGNRELAQVYEAYISNFPNMTTVDVSREIIRESARIRASYGFRLPDAIHPATAVQSDADVFITNDRRLSQFAELRVHLLSDFLH